MNFYINWPAVIPLGLLSVFFIVIGSRRSTRFFNENQINQRTRFRDLFLSIFDIASIIFCVLLTISPANVWASLIPWGLGILLFTILTYMMISYMRLYQIHSTMLWKRGISTRLNNIWDEKRSEILNWYEFIPFAFVIGLVLFFLINSAIVLLGRIEGSTSGLNDLGSSIGLIVGAAIGAIIVLDAYLTSKKK